MSDSEMQEPPSPDMDNEHGRAAAKRTAEREYSVEDLKRALHMILPHKRMWGTETARGADTTVLHYRIDGSGARCCGDISGRTAPHACRHRQRSLQLRTASFMCVCFDTTLHAPTIAVTCPMGRALTRPSSAAGHFVHPSSDGPIIGGPSFIGWSVRLGSLSGPQSFGRLDA